jgi:hypothetical protein
MRVFRNVALVAVAAATSFVALPAAAGAQGYYDYGRYERPAYDRYGRPIYSSSSSYNRGYANNGYYGRSNGYYGDRYYNGERCSKGTTGMIVGGAAGALLGREVTRDNRGWNRNSGTTGAIIGGAIGALAGRAAERSSCR